MSHEGASTTTDLLAPFRLKKCVACGYELRSRTDVTNCLKCGLDIRDALVAPPIRKGASTAAWIGAAALYPVTIVTALGFSSLGPFGYVALTAAFVLLMWRFRPRHKLGDGNLLITATHAGANDWGKLRMTTLADLAPVAVHREAPLPKTSHGQPLFRWRLEFCDMQRNLSTHFRATEAQADALRDEVERRMEAVGDDQPDNPSSE